MPRLLLCHPPYDINDFGMNGEGEQGAVTVTGSEDVQVMHML